MVQTFFRDGVRFQYPSNWTLEVEAAEPAEALDAPDAEESTALDAGWTVTVLSPATAFCLVSLRRDAATPAEVADESLAALRAEYPGLEAADAVDSLAGLPAVGYDLDFLTLDTAVTGWLRALDTTAGPMLVLCQASDHDRAANEPVLRAICASLQIVEE